MVNENNTVNRDIAAKSTLMHRQALMESLLCSIPSTMDSTPLLTTFLGEAEAKAEESEKLDAIAFFLYLSMLSETDVALLPCFIEEQCPPTGGLRERAISRETNRIRRENIHYYRRKRMTAPFGLGRSDGIPFVQSVDSAEFIIYHVVAAFL
jgi:hypothetical protein